MTKQNDRVAVVTGSKIRRVPRRRDTQPPAGEGRGLGLAVFVQPVYRILPVFCAKMSTRDAESRPAARAAFPDAQEAGGMRRSDEGAR